MSIEDIERRVKKCYSTWGESYYEDYYGEKAPYPPVHRDLLKDVLRKDAPKTLLDAGCGPASFLRELFDLKIDLYGFDLTPEMVQEGKRIFEKSGRPADRVWQGSILEKNAFRYPARPEQFPYDAAVCVGVLPHISKECDEIVIRNLHDSVRQDGLVCLEARNQLFGLFTMNRYSYDFLANDLIDAERLQAEAANKSVDLNGIFEDMKKQFRMDLPPVRKGKQDEPGYDEVLSRTHNPFTLREQFEKAGFKDVRTLFYHFHCLPPMFAGRAPEFFLNKSLAMEAHPEDWRGHFMASAFFVVGRKR